MTPTQGSSPRPVPGESGSTTVGKVESTSTHRPGTAVGPGDGPGLWQRIDRSDLARALSVAACAVAVGVARLLGASSWVLAPVSVVALVAGCWPIIVEAWEDVKARRMSMELSMLIAIAAAAAIGEWTTALVITTFVLAAEILEDLSMDRGRDALSDLMSFLPAMVRVRRGTTQVEIPLAEVRPGMVVVVEPGSRIPVDGTVLAGSASLDQSRLTGESLPVDVQVGDSVLAGSIALAGALEVTTRRAGEDSTFGQIVATVREAQESRAPVQRLADRLAGILVFIALGAALMTFLVTRDARATISVVIVAGACGIAAGTPLAILASIARAARAGAFVRDGTHLEVLSGVDTVVLDKTGTLTLGQARVVGVRPAPGVDEGDLLALAAGAEWHSEHPVGRALTTLAEERGVAVPVPGSAEHVPGMGVTARVGSREVRVGSVRLVPDAPQESGPVGAGPVHVAVDGEWAGTLGVADQLREGAERCVSDLRSLGLRVLMLTGDTEQTAQTIARDVGISEVHAGLLPADKHAVVGRERASGHVVAMVGDGVNDAPALAAADVGIAIGSGTDVARESADVVLISSDLGDLVTLVRTARRARRTIMVNFVGTLVVDAIGMTLAAFGVLGPVAAAVVHVGSESAFILNSARLIPGRARR
ncbi:MAG: cadmium-translocating P-type ATPase [Propionibacterium sp.]|nr:cadmium-translocating P-type ATPase [Propionibacterium sp.]